MPNAHLTDEVVIDRVMDSVAAGTSDQNSDSVDMQGFDAVTFVAIFGTLTANQVTQLHAEQSSDDGSADSWADIADSQTPQLADDDDDKIQVLDMIRPSERYVRCVVERGTANAEIDGVVAIKYRSRDRDVTQDSDVADQVTLVDAVEGTK